MHIHCLHWLMSTGLLLQSAFPNHVNPRLVKWCQWKAPIWQWGLDMDPLSAHICLRLVVEYSPLWVHVDAIATLNPTIVSSCFFVLAFAITHPTLHSSCPPLIYTGPILMNSMKKCQKLAKTNHYLLARLVVQS